VRFGVTISATDLSIGPAELAREVEARGFDSMFVPEHTHIPTALRTPYPFGGPLPDEYRRALDPFVALSFAAAATSRIRLGTGVCLVAQRDAIVTAKEVASLDHLSDGRFVFGIGFGWNREEMADHGVEYGKRRELVREKMLAMHTLWKKEEASFQGEHVRLEPSWAYPKPIQKPHPPVLIGGAPGPVLFSHIAQYADGWMPVGGARLSKNLAQLRQLFESAERDPGAIEVVTITWTPSAGKLAHFRDVGVTEAVMNLPSSGRDNVLSVLDEYVNIVATLER
jgi:probable F420-dependent oxidoreductase